MNLSELMSILMGKRYIKMYLLREGRVIGTYIRSIKETGWITDKIYKMAWEIPDEGNFVIQGKAHIFYGSLETIQPLKFKPIEEVKIIKKEISIPAFKIVSSPENIRLTKTKIIIRNKQEEHIFIDKQGKTYNPILSSLDLNALYDFLSGAAIRLTMRPPKEESKIDWDYIKWLVIGLGLILAFFYMRGGLR